MNIFLDRYKLKYKNLWNSLDVKLRKQAFVKMLAENDIPNKNYKKTELIDMVANYYYNDDEKMRLEYDITPNQITDKNVNRRLSYDTSYRMEEYQTDIGWITLSTNCCCNYIHTDNNYVKYQNINGTRHFLINLQTIIEMNNPITMYHINLHIKQQSDLYLFSMSNYLTLELDHKPCSTEPIVNPVRMNINLFDYQRKTINWMKSIEDNVNENKYLSKYINESYIVKIPNYPIYFDTKSKQTILSPCKKNFIMKYSGGILGDELGLGKTLTSIGLILSNPCTSKAYYTEKYNTPATLIAMPSHLIDQWVSEIDNHCTPSPRIITLTTMRDLVNITNDCIKQADIVLISFQLLINHRFNRRYIAQFNWYRIMIDEGHELLNDVYPSSIFEFLCHVNSKYRWYISGTPFLNKQFKVIDNIARFLHIKSHNTARLFTKRVLYKNYDKHVLDNDKISMVIDNLYIRNTKELISEEYKLPELRKNHKFIDFTSIEMDHYSHIKSVYRQHDRLRKLCCHMQLSDNDLGIFGQSIKTLDELKKIMITSRQDEITDLEVKLASVEQKIITIEDNSAFKALKTKYTAKILKITNSLNYLTTMIDQLDDNNTCSICFDDFTTKSMIQQCGHVFCSECLHSVIETSKKCPYCRIPCTEADVITIDCNTNETVLEPPESKFEQMQQKHGTKIAHIIKYIEESTGNDKILIFCEWDRMLDKITNILNDERINTMKCNGSIHRRRGIINKFKYNMESKVLALSLENTASGMNLTEAKHIIFINIGDSAKNVRTMEDQAISRSYRLGQKDPVNIVYFITRGTIEEEIYKELSSET